MLLDADKANAVNSWFERMEIPYTVEARNLAEDQTLTGDAVLLLLRDTRSGATVTLPDVGFGISQILSVVLQLAIADNRCLIVEQPELHLHPRVQSNLADLALDAVREDGRQNQIVMETHSEHLLLRFQRRIRSGLVDPKNICVLYVENQGVEGSKVIELELDSNGEFMTPWPHGFFPERLDELVGD